MLLALIMWISGALWLLGRILSTGNVRYNYTLINRWYGWTLVAVSLGTWAIVAPNV